MRYLIAAGTSAYRPDSGLADLDQALRDVERMAEFLTSPAMGYTRVLTDVSENPTAADLEDAVAEWCAHAPLTPDDVVVLYYAGHGDRPTPGGPYRLACADSREGRPRSWLSPQNLAETLAASPVRNVLFVIDACHAALGGAEIQSVTDGIVAARPRGDTNGAGTWVLASARHRDLADDGAFVTRLAEVCGRGDGPSQRYLAPSAVATRISEAFAADGRRQRAACSATNQTELPPFFPNPRHDPAAEFRGDGRAQGDTTDLSTHFDPRGRGVEHVHDPGSYFTGRRNALSSLRAHLEGPGGRGALVVTAAPGSGKSAVLGRVVLDGGCDVSVNARHQTLETLVDRLAAGADVRAAHPAALLTALAGRRTPFRVVVDSLDEAGPAGDKAEARRIAWDLLRPLGAVPCVRLVVGSRRELLAHLGEHARRVDLDSPRYAADTDAAEYVRRVLTDTGSPYADRPAEAHVIAREVARRAGPCFLVARMTASALLRGDPLDTTVPGWAETLPSDVGGAFEAYLRRLPRARHATAMALLTALAFGEGHGLPRRVWVRVAARLSGLALREADIDELVEEDGSYLTAVETAGARHFRLYHQLLTDHLRQRVLAHRDLRDLQECFVDVLLELTPARDWARALPYVRGHLATHAAGAGSIRALVADPAFLLAADPAGLLPAVRHASCDPVLAMAVERCADMLGTSAPPGYDRAARLAFAAEAHGAHALARSAEELSTSVRRVRVEARPVTPHRIVGRYDGGTYSTTSVRRGWVMDDVVLPDGTRVVLAAETDTPEVHVWPVDDPARATVLPHPAAVRALEVPRAVPGRALAVTLDDAGGLRLWDVVDQTVARVLGNGYDALLDAGRLADGAPAVVCHDEGGVVVLDLTGRTALRVPVDRAVDAFLVYGGGDGPHLVVVGEAGGTVTRYPLGGASGPRTLLEGLRRPRLLARPPVRSGSPVVALLELEEEDEGAAARRVTLLDCVSGATSTVPAPHVSWGDGHFVQHSAHGSVLLLRTPEALEAHSLGSGRIAATPAGGWYDITPLPEDHGGRLYAFTDDMTGEVTLWDCTDGRAVATLQVHESAVCGLHVLGSSVSGTPEVLTVGNDGTARFWQCRLDELRTAGRDERAEERGLATSSTELVRGWAARPHDLVVGSWSGLRLADWSALDRSGPAYAPLVPGPLPESRKPRDAHLAEDARGTVHALTRRDVSLGEHAEEWSEFKVTFEWQRLHRDGRVDHVRPDLLTAVPSGTDCHLIPPSTAPHTPRVVGYDPLDARLLTVDPSGAAHRDDAPWAVDPATMGVCSAGFTDQAGRAVLMVAVRQLLEGDITLGHRYVAHDPDAADAPARGYLWDAGARRLLGPVPRELPAGLTTLVPHHGGTGTRFVALVGRVGDVSVLDLREGRVHTVHSGSATGRKKPLTFGRSLAPGHGHFLRWADLPGGAPLLVHLDGAGVDDTVLSRVVVWDSADPDAPARPLPVTARRLLWTGFAPGGDALLAISDEQGVGLFHLPSLERVWSAPVPALVTSLTARPGSPHLDLAVATQQGVVLMRPRLDPAWETRLLRPADA